MTDSSLSAACGSCISRRDFVVNSAALAAVVAFLEGCSGDNGITDPTEPLTITVANFSGLATVNTLVDVGGGRAVKRTGTATFAAFSKRCTHEGTEVNIVNGQTFFCPNHGSTFNNNGQVTLGPAVVSLKTLATSYDAATDTLTIG